MPTYEVKISKELPGVTLINGNNVMIVEAESAADAKTLAQGHFSGAGGDVWAAATATQVAVGDDFSPVTNEVGEVRSYKLDVTIAGDDTNASFSYTAVDDDAFDDIFDAMVILLNAHADIAGAAFGSNSLTVAETSDGIGDHTVTATLSYGDVPVAGFLGAITDEGSAGAALAVATDSTETIPRVLGTYKS
jgi:hypothetical protein